MFAWGLVLSKAVASPLAPALSCTKTWTRGLTVFGRRKLDLPVRSSKEADLEILDILSASQLTRCAAK
jgi:hypothetical protein